MFKKGKNIFDSSESRSPKWSQTILPRATHVGAQCLAESEDIESDNSSNSYILGLSS